MTLTAKKAPEEMRTQLTLRDKTSPPLGLGKVTTDAPDVTLVMDA